MGELILGLLGGMAALAALLGGLWRRERGKRERAEARAETAEAVIDHGRAVLKADREAEADAATDVQRARERAREGGPRDHFET